MPSIKRGLAFEHLSMLSVTDNLRYIHANYRFIVDPRADYRKQALDSDTHLDWNNVLQILASAQSQDASCPICLGTPVAPRMAKCGHIFCLPCLIHYMHSTDAGEVIPEKKSRWKKCPICWDLVYMVETRPTRFFLGQEGPPPRENEDVVLRLMKRRTGSTLALPRDGAESLPEAEDVPWYFAAEVADYARIMKGSEDYMISSFDHEIEQIRAQEREDELMFGDETTWTRKAVVTIGELKEKVKGLGGPPNEPTKAEEQPTRPPIEFKDNGPEFYAIQQAAKSGQSFELGSRSSTILTEQSEVSNQSSSKTSTTPDTDGHAFHPPIQRPADAPFYFYQALSHFYLSPLDIRILRAAFEDYSSFPSTILPRVERVSTGHVVDDDLRRRAKYIGHLPYGCEVGFLECDWTDLVSGDILAKFQGEIDRRRKRNREKAAREEKERIRAEKEEEDKRWAAARRRRPSTSKARETSPVAFTTLQPEPAPQNSASTDATASSPPWGSRSRPSGGAFASLASPSTSPSTTRTVWGTTAVTPSSPVLAPPPVREPVDNDGWLQDWELDLLRHDGEEDAALAAQMRGVILESADASSAASPAGTPGGGGAGGKKKKKKKITLMSTNNRRAA
jgi:Zinc finger, C3HC4 type (RING finger)